MYPLSTYCLAPLNHKFFKIAQAGVGANLGSFGLSTIFSLNSSALDHSATRPTTISSFFRLTDGWSWIKTQELKFKSPFLYPLSQHRGRILTPCLSESGHPPGPPDQRAAHVRQRHEGQVHQADVEEGGSTWLLVRYSGAIIEIIVFT